MGGEAESDERGVPDVWGGGLRGRGARVGARVNVALGASSTALFSFTKNATASSHIRHVGCAGAAGQVSSPGS